MNNSLDTNIPQIVQLLDEPVSYPSIIRALPQIQEMLDVELTQFAPKPGCSRSEFIQILREYLANNASPRNSPVNPVFPSEPRRPSQVASSNRSPLPFQHQPHSPPPLSQKGANEALLLSQRLRQRQTQLATVFDDFALQDQIRVADLPELLNEFGEALHLNLSLSNPSELIDYFHDTAGEVVTFPSFTALLERFVHSSDSLQITPGIPTSPPTVEDGFRANLVNTLQNFQNTQAHTPEQARRLEELKKVLRQQIADYDKKKLMGGARKIGKVKKGVGSGQIPIPREEQCLREAFNFFAKSVIMTGKAATFDHIEKQSNVLYLGELLRFTHNFGFNISKGKVTEIFKRMSYNSRELTYEEFKESLAMLEREARKEEKVALEKKVKELESKHPTDSVNDYYGKYREAKEDSTHPEDEKKRAKERMKELEVEVDYRSEALRRIGVPDLEKIKAHLKQFTNAFGIKEVPEPIKIRPKIKRNTEEISRHLQEVRADRERQKREKEMKAKEKYEASKRVIAKIQQKLAGPQTYTGIQNKKLGLPPDQKHQKLTWKVLEDLSYTDINQDAADDFRPADMMLEEDDPQLEHELAKLGVQKQDISFARSEQSSQAASQPHSYLPAQAYGVQKYSKPQPNLPKPGLPLRAKRGGIEGSPGVPGVIVRHNSVPKGNLENVGASPAKARGSVPRNVRKQPGEVYVENYGKGKGSQPINMKGRKVAEDYYQRGAQLEAQSRLNQEMRLNRAMQVHQQNVKKGMLVARRKY